jgi:hypothetical protein
MSVKFNHIVDADKGLVIVKAMEKLSLKDIFHELQRATASRRGKGVPRRMIDLTEDVYDYTTDELTEVFSKMRVASNLLETRRIVILLKEFPKEIDAVKLAEGYSTDFFEIGIFDNTAEAVKFLNKPIKE